jgi:hypothetical protein
VCSLGKSMKEACRSMLADFETEVRVSKKMGEYMKEDLGGPGAKELAL